MSIVTLHGAVGPPRQVAGSLVEHEAEKFHTSKLPRGSVPYGLNMLLTWTPKVGRVLTQHLQREPTGAIILDTFGVPGWGHVVVWGASKN